MNALRRECAALADGEDTTLLRKRAASLASDMQLAKRVSDRRDGVSRTARSSVAVESLFLHELRELSSIVTQFVDSYRAVVRSLPLLLACAFANRLS